MNEKEQFPETETKETSPGKKKIIILVITVFLLIIIAVVGFSFYQNSTSIKSAPVVELPISPKSEAPTNTIDEQRLLQELGAIKNSMNQFFQLLEKQQPGAQADPNLVKLLQETQASIDRFGRNTLNENKNLKNDVNNLGLLIARSNEKIITQLRQNSEESGKTIAPFVLSSIDLWDSVPQATIRRGSKNSIVNIGDIRVGWKIINIDFDNETIEITKNGKNLKLEMIR